jgi:Fur family peroxide stress response transcriptional regulator
MRHRTLADRMDDFEQLCRRHGLPLTVQRRAVLQALAQRHDHPTADQVLDDVLARLPGVSRTTVYRVLDTLVEFGVARKVCHPGAAVRFEVETRRHHHLVCLKCDKMIDIEDSRFDSLPFPDPAKHGFQLSDYTIQFRGICPKCSAAAAGRRPAPRRKNGPVSRLSPAKEER